MSKSAPDWSNYFAAYCAFKWKKGKDAIPNNNIDDIIYGNIREKDLSKWMRKQNRDKSSLSSNQVAALNHAGFRLSKSSKERMDQTYDALAAYKSKHGNLLIPQTHVELGKVVQNLRALHKNLREGKASTLTDDYIQKLDDLGFVWVVRDNFVAWDLRYDLLVDYKNENGNCKVPSKYEVQGVRLGRWVTEQRSQFNKKEKGQKSNLTDKRMNRLNAIGFIWQVNKK